jgi:two-component system LytT family response regulator
LGGAALNGLMRNYARALGREPGSKMLLPSERKRYLTHLTVRKGDRIVILRVREIEAIESAGNYVVVQAGKDSLVVRETLAALSEQLEPEKFMRISRSAIVNLRHVRELLPNFVGDKVVVLQSGKHLTVTRRLRDVEEALKFA